MPRSSYRSSRRASEPWGFDLTVELPDGGEETHSFSAKGMVPAGLILETDAKVSVPATSSRAILDFFRETFLTDDGDEDAGRGSSRDRFFALINDPDKLIETKAIEAIYGDLVSHYTGRPTGSPGSS
jgi:hypothetical protein